MYRRLDLPRLARRAALPLAALTFTACDDAAGPGGERALALSFAAEASASGSTTPVNNSVFVSGSDTLRLSSVKLVFDEVELERGTSGECSDDGDDTIEITPECAELEMGPFLVNLPLNGSVSAPMAVQIPAGTYHELELKLEDADDDERTFRSQHPEMNGISVLVEGTFNGRPFTYRANVEAELEMEFEPSIVVGEGGTAITVNVNLARWFLSGTGAIIDPSTITAGSTAALTVATNIRASFEAFEDDDRDGHRGDDDGDDDSRN